jgi:formylglycine-generating enzyme required for sulfatase activity
MRSSTLALLLVLVLAAPLAAQEKAATAPGAPEPMVMIPQGTFVRGCSAATDPYCRSHEGPAHEVHLDAYLIDRHEVTVAEYRKCVDAGKCPVPGSIEDNKRCNWGQEDRDSHPINCVSWAQARTYCEFAGKRLPTEAEWEKAARGSDGRRYPWGGDRPDCELAVTSRLDKGCGKEGTWPVCSLPKGNSPFGLCDMVGNVWEWVADWYAADTYRNQTAAVFDKTVALLKNPGGPEKGRERVLRGGSWTSKLPESVRTSTRFYFAPDVKLGNFGFRCADDIEKGK